MVVGMEKVQDCVFVLSVERFGLGMSSWWAHFWVHSTWGRKAHLEAKGALPAAVPWSYGREECLLCKGCPYGMLVVF